MPGFRVSAQSRFLWKNQPRVILSACVTARFARLPEFRAVSYKVEVKLKRSGSQTETNQYRSRAGIPARLFFYNGFYTQASGAAFQVPFWVEANFCGGYSDLPGGPRRWEGKFAVPEAVFLRGNFQSVQKNRDNTCIPRCSYIICNNSPFYRLEAWVIQGVYMFIPPCPIPCFR